MLIRIGEFDPLLHNSKFNKCHTAWSTTTLPWLTRITVNYTSLSIGIKLWSTSDQEGQQKQKERNELEEQKEQNELEEQKEQNEEQKSTAVRFELTRVTPIT